MSLLPVIVVVVAHTNIFHVGSFMLCIAAPVDMQENQIAVFPRACTEVRFKRCHLIIAMVRLAALSGYRACVVA